MVWLEVTGADVVGVALREPPLRSGWMDAHDRFPVWFQRIENAMIAALSAVAFVDFGFSWWWLAVLFLLFDVSMVGYVRSPALGAWTYNAMHSYTGPAVGGVLAVVSSSRDLAFVSLVWAFHIGVDRLLGYGLKLRDGFTHTHLGQIGHRAARQDGRPAST